MWVIIGTIVAKPVKVLDRNEIYLTNSQGALLTNSTGAYLISRKRKEVIQGENGKLMRGANRRTGNRGS